MRRNAQRPLVADGGVRSLWSGRWRMRGLTGAVLTMWFAVDTWRAGDHAARATMIKLVLPAQAPSWCSAMLWGAS